MPLPPWVLNKLQHKFECKDKTNQEPSSMGNQPNSGNNNNKNNKNISTVIPYIQGIGVKFKRTCNNKGIQVHFKGTNTIKNTPHGTQRQRQQTLKEWGNLQIQMPI